MEVHRPAIFNVRFSPNLGDGIIAECLEGELCRADPYLAPLAIDLAGRTGYSVRNGRFRKPILTALEFIPAGLRSRIVPLLLAPLVRVRYASRWRTWLRGCDSVIIGGGALFADVDQNFPIKIAQALDLAKGRNLPVAIASVGMSDHWSAQGRRRLARRLLSARLIGSTVRDSTSSANWRSVLGTLGIKAPTLAPDPGLLSERQFGRPPRIPSQVVSIAVCVTAPVALRLHHEKGHADDQLEAWMRAVVSQLAELQAQVTVFTNGSPEDRLFRDKLQSRLQGNERVIFVADFARPADLARFLSGFDCVLAHRLHACIVAYAYRVPTVGFAWDRKLHSFFEQTRRDRFIIDPRETSPMSVVDLAFTAITEGVDKDVHAQLLAQTTTAIQALASQLVARVAAR
jgi:polysaccharide pyruvyl transferase WcaK-like protein